MAQAEGMTLNAPEPIVTRALGKHYRHGPAVEGLDLCVRKGEVYGFLGPNGAGKTTTLRMLLGLVRPTTGSASVLGLPPGHPSALARIGALVEEPAFYPYLSGRRNLLLLARAGRVTAASVDGVLDRAGLGSAADRRFRTYSLGMKQRLGVAGALLKDPELLVLDEPGNGLDPRGMVEMRNLIRGLRDDGRTVLLCSHLLAEVEKVCDRVGVIDRGRLVAEGTVEELGGGRPLEDLYLTLTTNEEAAGAR
jgi:ABC-2 type transport system ATP-binding protein